MTKRVAILISGGGSNMVALVKSMILDHPARPVLVLSNDPDAKGLRVATEMGINTVAVDHKKFGKDRQAFEIQLNTALNTAKPDIICLAGFMRVLTPDFVNRWKDKILNIHPSLLPKYKGLNTHLRAIEAGDKTAGCSVHMVTPKLDDGPILGQGTVPILPNDTPETLAARILPIEHHLYPLILRRFANGDRSRLILP